MVEKTTSYKSATIQSPTKRTTYQKKLHAEVLDHWIYRIDTGEILQKWSDQQRSISKEEIVAEFRNMFDSKNGIGDTAKCKINGNRVVVYVKSILKGAPWKPRADFTWDGTTWIPTAWYTSSGERRTTKTFIDLKIIRFFREAEEALGKTLRRKGI